MAEKVQQVAFRLPVEMVRALDAYVEAAKQKTPGLSVTRSDAVRILLSKVLEKEGYLPGRK